MEKVIVEKKQPKVYFRRNVPEEFLSKYKEISQVIIEPWDFKGEQPIPTKDLEDCDVLFTVGLKDDLEILKYAPNIKWIHSVSVGIDAMLNEQIKNSDIVITNSKGVTSIPIAEHTIAVITSFARGLPKQYKNQARQLWTDISVIDLDTSTVGIIGYGEIGYQIAKRCKSLGMKVIGCRRNSNGKRREDCPADSVVDLSEVNKVIECSDFIVLALPATEETIHFMDKSRLKKMKKNGYLINIGRGNTIVEKDLLDVLKEGEIGGVALDVFDKEPLPKEHPFWMLDNVIITPHIAYKSARHAERVFMMFLQNLQLYSEGKPLLNVVNKQLGY